MKGSSSGGARTTGRSPSEGDDLGLSSVDGRSWLVHRVEQQDERIAIHVRKTGAAHSPRLVKHHMTVPPDWSANGRSVADIGARGDGPRVVDGIPRRIRRQRRLADDRRELGLGLTGEQWIFLSYSLALAALYLPAGALGDRYGYANTFVIGVAGFAAASVLAGSRPPARC